MTAHTAPPSPSCVRSGLSSELPRGTHEILDAVPFPHGRVAASDASAASAEYGTDEALLRALVASFGVQWSDPDNIYNPHRGYASPRCVYPVQVFVDDGERWHLLEPERHALTALTSGSHRRRQRRIVLTGRYTRLPSGYKWFRGSLVNLELGIVLRSLALAFELFGVSGRLVLPHRGSAALLDELGLAPAWEWSLPTVIEIGPEPLEYAVRPEDAGRTGVPAEEQPQDAALRDLVRVNRTQAFDDTPVPVSAAVPAGLPPDPGTLSWAELMWQRNSGRTPHGLLGMIGRRTHMPARSVEDAIRWLDVPPPGPSLRAVSDLMTLTAVIQDVEGYADGIYRVRSGKAVQLSSDPTVAARLAAESGSSLDIRNASTMWFMSVKPRELFARFGANGWSAAQYWCGWAVHGLCLSTTAHGMFTRPVRNFAEIPTQRILHLDPDEMIALAAMVGTPKYPTHALLDVRV